MRAPADFRVIARIALFGADARRCVSEEAPMNSAV